MDRRPNAARVPSPAVWPGWIAGRTPRGFHYRLLGRDGSPAERRAGSIAGCWAGMDRRSSPHREDWAAWVLPQAARPRRRRRGASRTGSSREWPPRNARGRDAGRAPESSPRPASAGPVSMGFEKWEEMGFENLTLLGSGAGFPEGPSRGAAKRPASAFTPGGASVGSGRPERAEFRAKRSASHEVTSSSSPDRGAGFFSPGPDEVPAPGPRAGAAGSSSPGCPRCGRGGGADPGAPRPPPRPRGSAPAPRTPGSRSAPSRLARSAH